jgi:cellulose synthase/poly-beta-1,6-N-acetylglucosamine synthase-like glycosyltransferase
VSSVPDPRKVDVVGIVLPVHDEEELLPAALEALEVTIGLLPPSLACRVVVVLDDCRDGSSEVARGWATRTGALVLHRQSRIVGMARSAGVRAFFSLCPEVPPASIWIATTDADSRVPQDWLTVQLEAHEAGADLWAGRVRVDEESAVVRRWKAIYSAEPSPIHGANLGFSGSLYEQIGGFRSLRSGEDRDLLRRAMAAGFTVAYGRRATVVTSARRRGRAPGGFASVLDDVAGDELGASA